jgi:NAD(P)-dependent dehydrogenase (short-subunit alcohol dehydrogenase family)
MVNMSRLSNKVATVTGASKGIGGGIATALGAAGARVAVNYSSDREGAERVAQVITKNGGEAIAVGTFDGEAGAVLAGKTPLGRLGRITDIAPLAVFLASDESAWITGEVIRAAGGLVVAT